MRPELCKETEAEQFLQYYWLKKELIDFCRKEGLSSGGSKEELTLRIKLYLETEEKSYAPPPRRTQVHYSKGQSSFIQDPLSLENSIPRNYKNDERHRAFFKEQIGSHFKFNVPFMKWMRENCGKTYGEAIEQWHYIQKQKTLEKKTSIAPQFEYNRYTRDFFNAHPVGSRKDCIKCWKHKKSLPGSNQFEPEDLRILNWNP